MTHMIILVVVAFFSLRVGSGLGLVIENSTAYSARFEGCSGLDVVLDNWCYRLVDLPRLLEFNQTQVDTSSNCRALSLSSANSSGASEWRFCVEFLLLTLRRLLSVFLYNSDTGFIFTVLSSPLKNAESLYVWKKLVEGFSVRESKNSTRLATDYGIFQNHFKANSKNIYAENNLIGDNLMPNIMIHDDDETLSAVAKKCLFVSQLNKADGKITANNESFRFSYGDCRMKLPFICIKPFSSIELPTEEEPSSDNSERLFNDRCASFNRFGKGGNWMTCDTLVNMLSQSETNGTENKPLYFSESQKCCLFNLNYAESFRNANKFCSRFDSSVYSIKIKDYKPILRSFASYLAKNAFNTEANKSSSSYFWTSCMRETAEDRRILEKNEPECVDNSMSHDASQVDSSRHEALAGATGSLVVDLLNLRLMDESKKFATSNLKWKQESLDLVEIYTLLLSYQSNNEMNQNISKACADQFADSSNQQSSETSWEFACISRLFRFFMSSLFLVKKPVISSKLTRTTFRFRTNAENRNNLLLKANCGVESRNGPNDVVHFSLPYLNKCYHLTVFRDNMSSVLQDADSKLAFYYSSLYEPSQDAHNLDMPLSKMNRQTFYSILNSLLIRDANCSATVRGHSALLIRLPHGFLDPYRDENCVLSDRVFWFDRIYPLNLNYPASNALAPALVDSNLSVLLFVHSYSLIFKVLQLTCLDSFHSLKDQIHRCVRYYNYKFCMFMCPADCYAVYLNSSASLWQSDSYFYFASNSICLSALHSGLRSVSFGAEAVEQQAKIQSYFEGVLFTNQFCSQYELSSECSSRASILGRTFNRSYVFDNGIRASVWPPMGLLNRLSSASPGREGFGFRRRVNLNDNAVKDFSGLSDNYLLDNAVLVRAVNFISPATQHSLSVLVLFNRYNYLNKFHLSKLLLSSPGAGLEHERFRLDSFKYSAEFVETDSTSVTLNLTFRLSRSQLGQLNSFFGFCSLLNLRKCSSVSSIKFPVNMASLDSARAGARLSEHQIALKEGDSLVKELRLLPNEAAKSSCKWMFMNVNSEIGCSTPLRFNMAANKSNRLAESIRDVHMESLLIHPSFAKADYKLFSRVVFLKKNDGECSNNGLRSYSNPNKCLCYPGFGGRHCETTCRAGRFGKSCELACPNASCSGFLVCNYDPVGCSCASGFGGFFCNETCAERRWGPNCARECDARCPACEAATGECVCRAGESGKYCESCASGLFGPSCERPCHRGCSSCERQSGRCLSESTPEPATFVEETTSHAITSAPATTNGVDTTWIRRMWTAALVFVASVLLLASRKPRGRSDLVNRLQQPLDMFDDDEEFSDEADDPTSSLEDLIDS